jgi:4-amino-4-deoxy-L-arabinose transferase-like glycosyltransferase
MTPSNPKCDRADVKIIGAFLLIAFAARLACLRLNSAEYTDGILQITAFEYGFTFWPPLYAALTKALAFAFGDLITAGRLVSILASSLLVIPIYLTAHRLAGRRAAMYAVLFYLVNSIAGRWSIRVMSDALFACLFFWSAALLIRCFELGRGGRLSEVGQVGNLSSSDSAPVGSSGGDEQVANWSHFFAGNILGALSLLTRMQGLLILPLSAAALIACLRSPRNRHPVGKHAPLLIVALALWIAALAWFGLLLGAHGEQTAQRASASMFTTLLSYGAMIESFVLLFPYFITIPVFILFLAGAGLFLAGDRRQFVFAIVFLAAGAVIIGMQAVFMAFQERYLLPLIPFMMVLVGATAARWEAYVRRTYIVRIALAIILLYSLAWTTATLLLQRDAWGDLKRSAEFCRTLPPQARIFSNEVYRPGMPAVKMTFWAGRAILAFDGSQAPAAGDYVCLHSAYSGGLKPYPALIPTVPLGEQIAAFKKQYNCSEVKMFRSSLTPILPDIMEAPGTHPNPAWWLFRYTRQDFVTVILRIDQARPAK